MLDGGSIDCGFLDLLEPPGAGVVCPNGDCSIFNQQPGEQWRLIPAIDGLEWFNSATGDESWGDPELGLPDLADGYGLSLFGGPQGSPDYLLKQLSVTILSNPKCFGLFSKNPGILRQQPMQLRTLL